MKPLSSVLLAAIALLVGQMSVVKPAYADVLVTGIVSRDPGIAGKRLCVTVTNNYLFSNVCNGGDAQNWFTTAYGVQEYHHLCMDSKTPNPNNGQLVVRTCNHSPSQRWGLSRDGTYHNEAGWCMDIYGGNTHEGGRIGIWTCHQSPNQKFGVGKIGRAHV